MPIINHSSMFKLSQSGDTYYKQKVNLTYQRSLAKENSCFYIGIDNQNLIKFVFDFIPKIISDQVYNKKIFIMLGCEHESFNEIIGSIYDELIIKHNIPETQIIFITGTPDVSFTLNEICKKYEKNPIHIYFFSALERYIHFVKYTPSPTHKLKKFLSLNRRWRPHRPLLIGLLYLKNLLEYGHISFGESDDHRTWYDVFPELLQLHEQYPCQENKFLLHENYEKIIKLPEMYLDTDDLVQDHSWFTNSLSEFFETSYFSIVTETNFFTDVRFLTEKIFKTIIYKHPFILVAAPYSLAWFKSLGYKTFSPYIDESYDTETNHCLRMKMIVDEVERLCSLEQDEFLKLVNDLNAITEYNLNYLKSKTKVESYIKKLT